MGYLDHRFAPNLGFIYVLFWLFLTTWALTAIKDLVMKESHEREKHFRVFNYWWMQVNWEPWMCNFFVRFLYMAYLEIALCCFINYADVSIFFYLVNQYFIVFLLLF